MSNEQVWISRETLMRSIKRYKTERTRRREEFDSLMSEIGELRGRYGELRCYAYRPRDCSLHYTDSFLDLRYRGLPDWYETDQWVHQMTQMIQKSVDGKMLCDSETSRILDELPYFISVSISELKQHIGLLNNAIEAMERDEKKKVEDQPLPAYEPEPGNYTSPVPLIMLGVLFFLGLAAMVYST